MSGFTKSIFALMIITVLSSCKIIHALKELNRKSAKEYDYKYHEKDITFIPMHHLGKKKFYDDVKQKVETYKSKGYVVYYELVSGNFKADSLQKDTIRRKARKLLGFNGSYKDNAKGTFLDKYIQQPSYPQLGTDSTDKRADVTVLQLLNEWERVHGKLVLDSIDLHIPVDSPYERLNSYSRKDFEKIFVGYRNDYLISLIDSSSANKILILYGEGHRKDFFRKLKR